MLDRVHAARRRRRARAFLELGRQMTMEFATPDAGKFELTVRFVDEGETLVMQMIALYGLEFGPDGRRRDDPGMREVLRGRDYFCRIAADAGFVRIRFVGKRYRPEEGDFVWHSLEVGLDRWRETGDG